MHLEQAEVTNTQTRQPCAWPQPRWREYENGFIRPRERSEATGWEKSEYNRLEIMYTLRVALLELINKL
jgi:hypothetical protein